MPGSSRTAARACSAGSPRSRRPSSRSSRAASASPRSRSCFTTGTGSSPATSANLAGVGKALNGTPSTSCTEPKRAAIRSFTAAAATIDVRWESTAQHAASYGDQNDTGRAPGVAAASGATTGSAAATTGYCDASTSRESSLASCSANRGGGSPSTVAVTAPPSSWRTATPMLRSEPSTHSASRSAPSPVPR